MREQLQWTTPAPLWGAVADAANLTARRGTLLRPALLRFASDSFMDDFLALMQNDPARLSELIAQPETWRGPTPASAPVKSAPKFLQRLNRLRLTAAREKTSHAQSGVQTGALAGVAGLLPQVRGIGAQINLPEVSASFTGGATESRLGASAIDPTTGRELATVTKGAVSSSSRAKKSSPLKFYQPAHQRFYMIAACLVCARAGLPDRALNPGRGERVGFVVRRLLPPKGSGTLNVRRGLPPPTGAPDATWLEHALVTAAEGHGWRDVKAAADGRADVWLDGEELLPLFPVNYQQDEGRKRRLHAGLIPVGKREAYMGAPALPPRETRANAPTPSKAAASDEGPPVDPRMMPLWLQVTEPWKRLIERADAVRALQNTQPSSLTKDDAPLTGDALAKSLQAAREQIQTGSWYILLDLFDYLDEHLRAVGEAVLRPELVNSLTKAERAVYNALNTTTLPGALRAELAKPARYQGHVQSKLVDALREVRKGDVAEGLEQVAASYDREQPDPLWPTFLFPFADPSLTPTANPLPGSITLAPVRGETPVETAGRKVDAFANLIAAALPTQQTVLPESSLPLVAQRPLDMREGWFVLRCVYDRPECGPLDPPLVSAPTVPFQMANFFDPDAPARPLRIALPVDISPAGLRKFDKNAAFIMSDMLCGQVNRMKGLTLGDLIRSVLPWPLHKDLSVPDGGPCKGGDGLQVGMICSLSIPIITICALLLLMIIVSLLNIIFSWLPYFLICFPLPGLSAGKRKGA